MGGAGWFRTLASRLRRFIVSMQDRDRTRDKLPAARSAADSNARSRDEKAMVAEGGVACLCRRGRQVSRTPFGTQILPIMSSAQKGSQE
jgi:hypothetical protein